MFRKLIIPLILISQPSLANPTCEGLLLPFENNSFLGPIPLGTNIEAALQKSIQDQISIWDVIGIISEFRNTGSPIYERDIQGLYLDIAQSSKPRTLAELLLRVQSEHLNLLITASGKSFTEIGALLGSEDQLLQWTRGRKALTLETAIQLGRALGFDPHMVLDFLEDFDGQHLQNLPPFHLVPSKSIIGFRYSDSVEEPDALEESQARHLKLLFSKDGGIAVGSAAKAMGITPQAISAIKQGLWLLSVPKAMELSRGLKVSIWKIIGFVDEYSNSGSLPYEQRPQNTISDGRSLVANADLIDALLKAQAIHLRWIFSKYGKHMTHSGLGQQIDLSRERVNRLFNGKVMLSLRSAILIGRALNLSPKMVLSYLEEFDGNKGATP